MPPTDKPPRSAAAMLGALNERRFALLLVLLRASEPLTTTELATRVQPRSRGSLHRDLAALERAGLVRGDPAGILRQQGRRVTYEASRDVIMENFDSLAHQVQALI